MMDRLIEWLWRLRIRRILRRARCRNVVFKDGWFGPDRIIGVSCTRAGQEYEMSFAYPPGDQLRRRLARAQIETGVEDFAHCWSLVQNF